MCCDLDRGRIKVETASGLLVQLLLIQEEKGSREARSLEARSAQSPDSSGHRASGSWLSHCQTPQAQVLSLPAPTRWRSEETPLPAQVSERVPGRQVIPKHKILNGKKENQTKKIRFFSTYI